MTGNRFQYDPLPENRHHFRLLELLPGVHDAPLECRLRTENLASPPQYEALSYVWRVFHDSRDDATICIVGHVRQNPRPLCITKNLQMALQSLRSPTDARLMWADAICINQDDINERTEQVQRMRTIFSNAAQVLAWLGKVDFEVQKVFDFLGRVASASPRPSQYGSPDCDFREIDDVLIKARQEEWELLGRLHELVLFSRIWIVQEINLARAGYLLANHSQLSLLSFRKAVFWIRKRRPVKVKRFHIVWDSLDPYLYLDFTLNDPARPSLTNSENPQPTHYVLRSVRNCACTTPHDKIFALLSHCSLETWLAGATGQTRIPIDYNIPYSTLYRAVAQRLLEEPQPLLTLSLVEHDEASWDESNPRESLPSWVPDWRRPSPTFFLPNEFRVRYNTATGRNAAFQVNGQALEVQGCIVDKVAWRSPTMSSTSCRAGLPGLSGQASDNVFRQIWTFVNSGACTVPGEGATILETFCLTLNAGNRLFSAQTYKDEVTTTQRSADCLEVLDKLGVPVHGILRYEGGDGDCDRFLATTESLCKHRCFFVTDKGLMGLGPRVTAVGDEVCAFYGSQVPFVLHPSGSDGTHRLAGECYTHGIMNGEAINDLEKGSIIERTFLIS